MSHARMLARAAGLRRTWNHPARYANGRQNKDWSYVVSRIRRAQKRQEERDWRRQEEESE